jgi:hypothetical protein
MIGMLTKKNLGWLRAAMLLVPTAAGIAAPAQAVINEPDESKPIQISGCMTARTKSGGFILSSVFGRPVNVIGPNYLQVGLGHQVTLTGNWQNNGIAPNSDKVESTRMFVATAVKVTGKQCATPPAGDPNAKPADPSKQQR